MKQSMRTTRGVALLAAGLGLCFAAGTAQAQRGSGGRGGRAASATGTSTQSAASTGGQSGGCMSGSGSSSSGTTTGSTGTTTSGTSTSTGTVSAQSTGAITVQRTAAASAIVQYTGSTSSVQKIYLAVLDANGDVVSQRLVTPGRAVATLAVNSSSRYYGVMVVYANGTTRSTYAPVR